MIVGWVIIAATPPKRVPANNAGIAGTFFTIKRLPKRNCRSVLR